MEKILVTGGAGFIGSHLVKALAEQGHHVIVADTLLRGNKIRRDVMDRIDFRLADVRDREMMVELSKGCSLIYHFAAVLGVDVVADNPVETMETEVIGMQNICNAALKNNISKIIYASTSGIYGHSAIDKTITENIEVDPRTSYAIAKRYNEIYLAAQHIEKGLNSISVRFFNIYGKAQDNRMVIPRFVEQAMKKEPLTVYGDGMQTRDFTYIDDTIKSCLMLSDHISGAEIYNIANEKEITILDLAKEIIRITGTDSEVQFVEAPKKRYDYEVGRRWGSSQKLYEKINYKPETNLEQGLKRLLGKV